MSRLNIRWQLTLWYGGVLAVVIAVFSAAVYFVLQHQMLSAIDEGLREELTDVLAEFQRAKDEPSLGQWLDRRFAHHEGFDFQITRKAGARFFASERLAAATLPNPLAAELSRTPALCTADQGSDHRWRLIGVLADGPSEPLTVAIGRSLDSFNHESQELLLTFLLVGPLTLAIVTGGGYFLAQDMAPVDAMVRSADRIRPDRLDERIPIVNPGDELGGLARTLNGMMERLERSFVEMRRFTADAAHELRTPLAVIRNETEVALRTQRSPDEYANVLANVLEEVNHLGTVADQLLFLCRQDAQLQVAIREDVAVDDLLREVVSNMVLVAQEKSVALNLDHNPRCRLISDAAQLRRVFYNLLDNAIKYTPAGGRVTVIANVQEDRWSLAITDTGIGITAEHLPHVFERFYRADPARAAGTGTGLGLAICKSIVNGLGGSISLDSTPGVGTQVHCCVPLVLQHGG